MNTWAKPHISKVPEALTAIADGRIEMDGNHAKCYSSSKGKFYEIDYDPETNSIMSNDNTAFFTGAVSYPMIAVLMLKGKLEYDPKLLDVFKGIVWKDIISKLPKNKGKNDYDKAVEVVLEQLGNKGEDVDEIRKQIIEIHEAACRMDLKLLGKKRFPPKGY